MEKLYDYEAPQVSVIEVEVEKGFAASLNGTENVGDHVSIPMG